MPKMKTHRGAKKRFKMTASGNIRRRRAGKSHKLGKKTSARKRRLKRPCRISGADRDRIKRILPYG